MSTATDYDVIIIGSGAGGGTLARHLAPSGKRILILERGDWLPREIENWDAEAVFVKNRYVPRRPGTTTKGKAFQPGHPLLRRRRRPSSTARRCTGCGAEDFGELQHHDGISPAWPISYDDMEPYYTRAEQLYEVHGDRGEDPTEPPASAPYPYPGAVPRAAHPAAVRRPGAGRLPPVPRARAASLLERRPCRNSACIRCRTCDGFPCLVQAKSDAEMLGVRPALEHPNVTLLTNARSSRGSRPTPPARRSPGSMVERDGRPRDLPRRHRRRLGRRRELRQAAARRRPTTATRTASPTARTRSAATTCSTTAWRSWRSPRSRTRPSSRRRSGVNDFYFGMPGFEYPMGNIQMVGKSDAADVQGREAAPDQARADVHAGRGRHARRRLLALDRGPAARRTTGSRWRRDGNITLSYTPNNQEPKERLYDKLKSMLGHLGMHPDHLMPRTGYLKNDIPIAGVAHQAGTVRFGTDPATSVLDVDCKAHELDNLYVVDTSFFPSIGAVNPALTAMANALRVGDHLLERLGRPAAPA